MKKIIFFLLLFSVYTSPVKAETFTYNFNSDGATLQQTDWNCWTFQPMVTSNLDARKNSSNTQCLWTAIPYDGYQETRFDVKFLTPSTSFNGSVLVHNQGDWSTNSWKKSTYKLEISGFDTSGAQYNFSRYDETVETVLITIPHANTDTSGEGFVSGATHILVSEEVLGGVRFRLSVNGVSKFDLTDSFPVDIFEPRFSGYYSNVTGLTIDNFIIITDNFAGGGSTGDSQLDYAMNYVDEFGGFFSVDIFGATSITAVNTQCTIKLYRDQYNDLDELLNRESTNFATIYLDSNDPRTSTYGTYPYYLGYGFSSTVDEFYADDIHVPLTPGEQTKLRHTINCVTNGETVLQEANIENTASSPITSTMPSQVDCATYDLACYVSRAIRENFTSFFTFTIPTDEFASLKNEFLGKAPFAYANTFLTLDTSPDIATDFIIPLGDIVGDESANISLADSPLFVSGIGWLKTIEGAFMWIIFAIYAYHRSVGLIHG